MLLERANVRYKQAKSFESFQLAYARPPIPLITRSTL